MLFLAELNNLEAWATDVGNAYLEAETTVADHYLAIGPRVNKGIRFPFPEMFP